MALTDTLLGAVRSLGLGGVFFGGSDDVPSANDRSSEFGVDSTLTDEMRNTIAERITDARKTAEKLGEDFSIEHYRQECEAFAGTDAGKKMGAKWTPASYADLSGQDLHGIRLTNPKAIQSGHELNPSVQADYDSFRSIEADYDSFNRDGDGQVNVSPISQFYDRVQFDKKTDLRNAIVDPATSFNKEIASAGNLDGLTINNMVDGDSFEFGAGTHTKIKMTGIKGGEIIFGDGTGQMSRVEKLEIEGTKAIITMRENAIVNNVSTSDRFRVVNLSMAKGATLSGDLTNATISMASEFEPGSIFQDLTLGENVKGLDFSGLTFNNVTFNGSNLSDTSFAGATLNGVAFNGIDINTIDLSGVRSFVGTVNGEDIASARDLQMKQLASNITIPTWSTELNNLPSPAAPAPAQPVTVIETSASQNKNDTLDGMARAQGIKQANEQRNGNDPLAALIAAMTAAGVSRGEEATSSGAGTAIAVLKRLEKGDGPDLGSGNMQRSGGSATA